MVDKKITDFASIPDFSDLDVVAVVDVSDTSEDVAGSSFKGTIANLLGHYVPTTSGSSTLLSVSGQDIVVADNQVVAGTQTVTGLATFSSQVSITGTSAAEDSILAVTGTLSKTGALFGLNLSPRLAADTSSSQAYRMIGVFDLQGAVSTLFGVNNNVQLAGSGSDNVTNVIGNFLRLTKVETYTGTIANFYGAQAANATGTPTLTNQFGFYTEALTAGTNNWSFYNAGAANNALGNGLTGLGTVAFPSTGSMALIFGDGTVPATMGSNTAGLYANDVSGTVEMFAIDEADNKVQLTSHYFDPSWGVTPDPDEPYPWTYYAKNQYLGIETNVDMTKLARCIEKLTRGELDISGADPQQIIYTRELPAKEWLEWRDTQRMNIARLQANYEAWEHERDTFEPDEVYDVFVKLEPQKPEVRMLPEFMRVRLQAQGRWNEAEFVAEEAKVEAWKRERGL